MNEVTVVQNSPLTNTRWTDRFCLDLAMTLEGSGDKLPGLLVEYGYTTSDLKEFSHDPLFEKRVAHWRAQLLEHGMTFRLKAKAQAELLLDTSWDIIHGGADVSPAVKADLIKWTAKVAGFEMGNNAGASDSGVVININMGDTTKEIKVADNG